MGSQEEKRAKIIAAQAAREAADRASGRLPPITAEKGRGSRGAKKGPGRPKAAAEDDGGTEEVGMPDLPEIPDTSDL